AATTQTFVRGYHYQSEDANFTSLIIPDLPGDLTTVELVFGNEVHTLNEGDTFYFTSYVAEGVDEFELRGFPTELDLDPNALAPFAVGLTFSEEGLVTVVQTVLTETVEVPTTGS